MMYMAQYKVPQDVEADDKLIGPFSFRQFVYLLISAGLIAVMVGLFQIFPLLAIIPVLPLLLFLALALPIKKDQPMETYLAALVSYYIKPRKRFWVPGQRESTILITAPKIVETVRSRDLSEDEAMHRLSFLADLVDTEGQSIKNSTPMRDDLYAEATATSDMFDNYRSEGINRAIAQEAEERRQEAVNEMREAIERSSGFGMMGATLETSAPKAPEPAEPETAKPEPAKLEVSAVAPEIVIPEVKLPVENPVEKSVGTEVAAPADNPTPKMRELANNNDISVATIAKEAKRIKRKEDGEVFISLH